MSNSSKTYKSITKSLLIFAALSVCEIKVFAAAYSTSYLDETLARMSQQQEGVDNSLAVATSQAQVLSNDQLAKMTEFSQSKMYECPIFSNSPYSELLTTIGNLQHDIDSVFPPCENTTKEEKAAYKAALTEKINKIKIATERLNSSQTNLIESSNVSKQVNLLQQMEASKNDLISFFRKANNAVSCYQSSKQRLQPNIVRINEFIQSLAPAATDIISKIGTSSGVVGSGVKSALIGVQFATDGLDLLTDIVKSQQTVDMSDPSNRMNTIKNICYFMKIYNRVQASLQANQNSVDSYLETFEKKMNSINSFYRKQAYVSTQQINSVNSSVLTNNPQFKLPVLQNVTDVSLLEDLKTVESSMQQVVYAVGEIEYKFNTSGSNAKGEGADIFGRDLNSPDLSVTKCEYYLTLRNKVKSIDLIAKIKSVSNDFKGVDTGNDSRDVVFDSALTVYDTEDRRLEAVVLSDVGDATAKASDQQSWGRCAQYAPSWISSLNNVIYQTRDFINRKKTKINQLGSKKDQMLISKIEDEQKDTENVIYNLKLLKSFVSDKDIVFGEVVKQFSYLYANLFGSSDMRKSGPAYDLLKVNEIAFSQYFEEMQRAISYVLRYEASRAIEDRKIALQKVTGDKAKASLDMMVKDRSEAYKLSRVKLAKNSSTQGLVVGTSEWEYMCDNINLAITKYLAASSQLMQSQALCNMISPVLKEPMVSTKLNSYCKDEEPSVFKGFVFTSTLKKLHAKMLGVSSLSEKRNGGQIASEVQCAINFSPKNMISILIQKQNELKCINE